MTAEIEPKISDLLDEPIFAALMASDGVDRTSLDRMIDEFRTAVLATEVGEA